MLYDVVFEGGGAKGIAFVGGCAELLARGHTFDRMLGTSAGAITATLLAAGYTTDEMLAALVEKENGKPVFAGFMGKPPPFTSEEIRSSAVRKLLDDVDLGFLPDFIERKLDDKIADAMGRSHRFRHLLALVERGGWFAADRFVTWLETHLDTGTFKGEPRRMSKLTLAGFFERTDVDLSMVATDTTAGDLLVLNHHTAPDCPVVRAVRMSMSIPLVWDEVVWHASWGPYLGRDIAGHVVVDGGVLSNFPIELFISDAPEVVRRMGPKRSNEILGLLIDERVEVPVSKGIFVDVNVDPKELRIVRRLRALVDTATSAHDKMVMDEYASLVVHLPAKGYGTTEFDMTDARREALVHAGRTAMAAHLDAPGPNAAALGGTATGQVDRVAKRLLGVAAP
jgi:NTE family protein